MYVTDVFLRDYPKIHGVIKNNIPNIIENKTVWNAFELFADVPIIWLRTAISWGSMPALQLSSSNSSDFYFDNTTPNNIYIDVSVASGLEQNLPSIRWTRFLEGKLLHELVHWAHFNGGRAPGQLANVPNIPDQGERFEYLAYGQLLGFFPRSGPAAHVSATPNASAAKSASVRHTQQDATASPRGIRNNNPCNIVIGSPWNGLMDRSSMTPEQRNESKFCVFESAKWGIRAAAIILMNYQEKHKLRTVRSMIGRWAPVSDGNDADGYAIAVAKAMDVDPDTPFRIQQDNLALLMIKAMIVQENGAAYRDHYGDDVLKDGLLMAGIT